MYVCMYVCIYIYLFIYIGIYLYIYIYTHGKCGNTGLSFEASLLLSHYRRGFCNRVRVLYLLQLSQLQRERGLNTSKRGYKCLGAMWRDGRGGGGGGATTKNSCPISESLRLCARRPVPAPASRIFAP